LAVLPADVQDRDGARHLLGQLPDLPRLTVVWADGAYQSLVDWVRESFGWVLTTILRPLGVRCYVHLPKRWIVERTFGWFGRYRWLSKDYEHNPASSEAWVYIAMTHRMSRLMLPARDPDNRLPRRRRRRRHSLHR
jgi:putative transposase